MKIAGHFEDGKVVFDVPPPYADGTPANVEANTKPFETPKKCSTIDETAEEWIARLKSWIAKQPVRNIDFDDSRDSIYN